MLHKILLNHNLTFHPILIFFLLCLGSAHFCILAISAVGNAMRVLTYLVKNYFSLITQVSSAPFIWVFLKLLWFHKTFESFLSFCCDHYLVVGHAILLNSNWSFLSIVMFALHFCTIWEESKIFWYFFLFSFIFLFFAL